MAFSTPQRMRTGTALAALVLAGQTALSAPAAEAAGLGEVTFRTSCAAPADAAFREGLTLLHHMMYVQAEAAFTAAAGADPDCAMLEWGVAMSNFHPLWAGRPSEDETGRGGAAAARLAAMTGASPIEDALIAAALAFYKPANGGYRESIAAWAAAQAAAFEAFPGDIDVAALFALSQLATAPRGDPGMARQRAAGDLLDRLHAAAPLHPGVIHYAIHAYDNPPLAERGRPYAEVYGAIAPEVPHALHMPTHIFVRLGMWDEAVSWNARSATAAKAQPVRGTTSVHYAHAMDYLIYAHLQRGEVDAAQALLDELVGIANHQPSFGSAYALAAAPVRVPLEQGDWAGAAALPAEMHGAIDWAKFPQCEAMRWYARGLGAVRSGDADGARAALARLAELRAALEDAGQGYWARLTEAQMLGIEGWLELAQGNAELAVQLQTKAADIEDAAGKSPVTPGHVLPARELLGDMLAELGRADAARRAYEATLAQTPNRRRSLLAIR